MKYRIVSDCSANIMSMEDVDFGLVPLHVIIGDKDFVDDGSVDVANMQKALDEYKGKTSTSCPSPQEWQDAFGDAEVVFCVTITSGLSGANASANIAKDIYESENEGRKVYVFDSLSAGPEVYLIVNKIKELVLQELDAEEIYHQVLDYMNTTHLYFSLASLDNFARNGRVSPIVAKGIGLLNIRICGKASEEGTLQPMDKCRGDKKALKCLIEHMKRCEYTDGKVAIAHNNNLDGANELKRLIGEEFGVSDVEIHETTALCSYYAEPQSILLGFEA